MSLTPQDPEETPFDPGSMPSSSLSNIKAVWYRRPWFFATVGIVVVIAISVVTDLPHPISKSEDAIQQNGVIKLINGDAAPCIYALNESYSFYRQEISHSLSASNLKTVKNYLLQDQTVCSFASGPISDMTNTIQVSKTTAGKKIDEALSSVVKWLTYDGVGTILDIEGYFAKVPFHMNVASLSHHEDLLQSDRTAVLSDIQAASSDLGVTLTPIKLPDLPRLPGS